jgi:DNA repair protein RadC
MLHHPNKASIKNWHEQDRPREKAMQKGLDHLSDSELISILLSTGSREKSALDLARELLANADHNLYQLGKQPFADFCKVKGMGPAKAIILASAIELGRRRAACSPMEAVKFGSSPDIFRYLGPRIADLEYEEFWVLYLNKGHRLIQAIPHFKGGMTSVVVDVKLIMRKAVELGALTMVLAHNHPSGRKQPSQHDIDITRKMKDACMLFDIILLDHMIIAGKDYFSFADEGVL